MFVYLELVENNPFWAHYSKFFKNLVRSSSSISFETVLMKFGSVHGQAHTVSTRSGSGNNATKRRKGVCSANDLLAPPVLYILKILTIALFIENVICMTYWASNKGHKCFKIKLKNTV